MLSKIRKYLPSTLLVVAMLALAGQLWFSFSFYANLVEKALRYPYTLDYGEGPLLDQTLRLARFENIYHNDLDSSPYTISNYPPLFILSQVPFAWIFGPALWYGRLIALLAALLSALFIALTLRALGSDWPAAAIGGVALLTIPYLQQWSLLSRIDDLALAFSWAALYVTVRYVGPFNLDQASFRALSHSKSFWLAVALFVASIYTRQTYALAAPLAAFAWLLFASQGGWQARLHRAFALGIAIGGVTLALFLALNLLTAGGFYLNIVTSNVNDYLWETVFRYLREIVDHYLVILIFSGFYLLSGAGFLIVQGLRRQPVGKIGRAYPLVVVYLLAAAAGSLTIGKDGSNVNYLLEFSAALVFTTGALLSMFGRQGWLSLARVLVIGLLIYQTNGYIPWAKEKFALGYLYRMFDYRDEDKMMAIIRQSEGIVITDEYMALVPLAGKQLYFQPFEYKQLSQGKVWDEQNFLQDIVHQKFDLILWYQPGDWPAIKSRYTPAQIEMIEKYYPIDIYIGDVQVRRPK